VTAGPATNTRHFARLTERAAQSVAVACHAPYARTSNTANCRLIAELKFEPSFWEPCQMSFREARSPRDTLPGTRLRAPTHSLAIA